MSREQADIDGRGIAASDVEAVVVKHAVQFGHHFGDAAVPFLLADAGEFIVPQPGSADFDIRHEPAVHEEGRAHAGPQCQDQFHPFAGDRAESLHVGVICRADRLLELRLQRLGQVEIFPLRGEVHRSSDDPVPDDAGKSHRDAVERTEILGQLFNREDDLLRLA